MASGATTRLFKIKKVITITFSALAADTLLLNPDGNFYNDISDVNWQRIIMEHNVTTLTGTNVIFKMLTTNDSTNGGATTDPAATQADGSTAVVSATVTSAGRGLIGVAKQSMDGGTVSNIGKYIGVWADVTAVTVLTGSLSIYVEGQ